MSLRGLAGRYELQPGALFAQLYRVERPPGRCALGSVWAAVDEEVGDRIALEVLVAESTDAEQHFRRGVRVARRLTHHNGGCPLRQRWWRRERADPPLFST